MRAELAPDSRRRKWGVGMIYSDQQRGISAKAVERLRVALDAAKTRDEGQAWLRKAEVDALQSEVERIDADIAEYDKLKAGERGSIG